MNNIQTNQTTQSGDRLLFRVREAANRLDVSVSQIYNLINRGDISTVKLGEAIRIPARELNRLAGL